MIGVVIADDHPIFLDGLCRVIESQPDFTVLASVHSGEAAVQAVKTHRPQILVSDISMAGMGGIEAVRHCRAAQPEIQILVLSMHSKSRHVLMALDAGANGYMLKDSARDELITALRTLVANEAYLSPGVAKHVVAAATSDVSFGRRRIASLTAREREILCLIASGETTKQIAASLSLSPKTVATHREHLMSKLDVHNIAELTRFVIREELMLETL